MSVLEALRDRLWIPYHVGVEFQRRRVGVIFEAREKADLTLNTAQENLDATQEKVRALELEKSGLDIDPDKLLAELAGTSARLIAAIQSMHDSLVDVSASDPIRDQLDELFAGKVGSGPSEQTDVDQLVLDGEDRYERSIPPGFRDAGKEKDPKEASFLFGGHTYESKYGDLIIWRQLLAQARETKAAGVLFVTSDQKDDWWWIDHGRTLGPHPELVNEMETAADVKLFWMYSAKSFANLAGQFTSTRVSDRSLGDIDAVEMSAIERRATSQARGGVSMRPHERSSSLRRRSAEGENAVFEWLLRRGHAIARRGRGQFADFLVDVDGQSLPHGVDVRTVSTPRGMMMRHIDEGMTRAYVEIAEGRLQDWSMIVVVAAQADSDEGAPAAEDVDRVLMRIDREVERARERMPSRDVNVLAGALEDGEFVPIRGWGNPFL